MHLRRHLSIIAFIDHRRPVLAHRLRVYFKLPPGRLIYTIPAAGLCQADVVLALIRFGSERAREIAELMIGKPITICPSCLLRYSYNHARPRVSLQPVITWVLPNPPLRQSTKIAHCYSEFRVGRTREQLLYRGVSRGDIRRAVRRGWIKMSEGVRV
jgi:hypothetical protein